MLKSFTTSREQQCTQTSKAALSRNSEASRLPCAKLPTAASARAKGILSMASDCSEKRSEEHVRQTCSTCGANQQHQRKGPCITTSTRASTDKSETRRKTLAVKEMPESLRNYRFWGTAMTFDVLITALGNIMLDEKSWLQRS